MRSQSIQRQLRKLGQGWQTFFPWFADPLDPAVIGTRGERAAAKHLKKQGYRILVRNYQVGWDEIDLVARDPHGALVFVEVRTRSEDAMVPGAYSISPKKQAALRRVCRAYLKRIRQPDIVYRFDLAEVTHSQGKSYRVAHFENLPLFRG